MNDNDIEKRYVSDEPFSFGGKYRLHEHFGKEKKKLIDKSLKASDIYSRFFQYKKPRRYSPVYVHNKRELFQCDLVTFTNKEIAEKNDGYLYLFTTIDVFTKYAWVYKLKNKECKTVMKCFADILSKCGKKPERVQTDRGSEFVCKAFKKYFKDQDIYHYVSYSDRKCPVIERFNLTIQSLLYKIMDHQSTLRWIDCIDKAMKIYLNRKHGTIKMSPMKAELKKNEKIVRRNLYKYFAKSGMKPQRAKFKIGDTVRLWKYHGKFERGYDSKFTYEYFKIFKILKNLPVVRYRLKDVNGEEILGSYFQDELIPYTEPEYHKTIVLDTRGKGKNKMYLVKYEGWDDKYNRWVKEQDTINLEGSEGNEFTYLEGPAEGDQNGPNHETQNELQRSQTEVMPDNDEVNSIDTNSFYENMINQDNDNENSIILQDSLENKNMFDTHKTKERVPQKIMVNVVSDDDIENIVNTMEKNPKMSDKHPRGKTLRISTTDDKSIESMNDIHPREIGKKHKRLISDSKNVNKEKRNDSSEMEKVFKSSRRGI